MGANILRKKIVITTEYLIFGNKAFKEEIHRQVKMTLTKL